MMSIIVKYNTVLGKMKYAVSVPVWGVIVVLVLPSTPSFHIHMDLLAKEFYIYRLPLQLCYYPILFRELSFHFRAPTLRQLLSVFVAAAVAESRRIVPNFRPAEPPVFDEISPASFFSFVRRCISRAHPFLLHLFLLLVDSRNFLLSLCLCNRYGPSSHQHIHWNLVSWGTKHLILRVCHD